MQQDMEDERSSASLLDLQQLMQLRWNLHSLHVIVSLRWQTGQNNVVIDIVAV